MQVQLTAEQVDKLYAWIEQIPISRSKKNLTRDFSDGVAVAEIVHHYFPRLVDVHNYPSANGPTQKLYNWKTLKAKCLKKINYYPSEEVLSAIANAKPGFIELLLYDLMQKINMKLMAKIGQSTPQFGNMDSFNAQSSPLPPIHQQGGVFQSYGAPSPVPQPYQMQPMYEQQYQPQMYQPPMQSPYRPPNPHLVNDPRRPSMLNNQLPVKPQTTNRGSFMRASISQNPQPQPNLPSYAEALQTVKLLQQKVTKLEELLQIKDKKIEELSRRIRR